MRALLVTATLLCATQASAVNFCGNTAHQNTCGRPTNIYPCCPNGSNCTWWAWEMVCRNWGIGLVNWGNANTWGGYARNDPRFTVGGPQAGAIATSTLGNYGHVAWVIGASGASVTVTEQNCCSGCSANVRTISYPASKFNSGYVVRKGSECVCSAGQTQSQACGNCGTRTRSCNGCGWGEWGACGGADPNGGTTVCDLGAKGVCAEARQRCVAGTVSCTSITEASAEVCDGLDNDCNDAVDDGHPAIGAVRPAFAATLIDASWPRVLKLGETATMWAEFRNDGTQTWTRENLWLGAFDDSRLGAQSWPAFNVAALVPHAVQPGESARFSFEISATFSTGGKLTETFTLQQSNGTPVACPTGDVSAEILVLRADGARISSDEEDAGVEGPPKVIVANSGCSAVPGLAWLAPLAMLGFRRRRA